MSALFWITAAVLLALWIASEIWHLRTSRHGVIVKVLPCENPAACAICRKLLVRLDDFGLGHDQHEVEATISGCVQCMMGCIAPGQRVELVRGADGWNVILPWVHRKPGEAGR